MTAKAATTYWGHQCHKPTLPALHDDAPFPCAQVYITALISAQHPGPFRSQGGQYLRPGMPKLVAPPTRDNGDGWPQTLEHRSNR